MTFSIIILFVPFDLSSSLAVSEVKRFEGNLTPTLHSRENSFQSGREKIARFIGAAKINIFKSSSVTAAHFSFSCNKAGRSDGKGEWRM
jgi:hypothetical protein